MMHAEDAKDTIDEIGERGGMKHLALLIALLAALLSINAVLFLAGAHVLIALWHHFVLRDNTINRMVPR